jgi:hypothetical protein
MGKRTHGMSKTPIYRLWNDLLNIRDKNDIDTYFNPPKNRAPKAVSKEWLKFENFYRDMGAPPCGSILLRRDESQPFCKENCYWDTETNKYILTSSDYLSRDSLNVYERTKAVYSIAKYRGLKPGTVYARARRGWDESELYAPARLRKKPLKFTVDDF